MKYKRLLLAFAVFLIPIIGRTLWFYQGFPVRRNVELPKLGSIDLPEPRFSVPETISNVAGSTDATILIDQAHKNVFELTEIEPLHSELLMNGATILSANDYGNFLKGLQKADAVIIAAPTEEYTAEEIEAVEEFVKRGGKLLVIADPTRSNAEHVDDKAEKIVQINALLQPFGLSINNDYVYNLYENEGNFRNVYVQPSVSNRLTGNISQLVFYGSHSIDRYTQSLIAGDGQMASSLTDQGDGLSVAALNAEQSVLVVGDLTFMTNPFHLVEDNYQFIQNIAQFLMDSTRVKNFYDFPDLFTQDIGIMLTEGISLDSELLAVLSELQEQYAEDDLSIALIDETDEYLDEIILAIYPPSEENKPLMDDLGFIYENGILTPTPTALPEIENTPEPDLTATPTPFVDDEEASEFSTKKSIIIPEFGKIPRSGFGFLFVNTENSGYQLVLLADSQENCVNLLRLLSTGSLDGCLVGDSVAVCEQDIQVFHLDDHEEELEPDTMEDEEALPNDLEDAPITPTPSLTPIP